jgi:tetratricopeptide (TPR) repeat protein
LQTPYFISFTELLDVSENSQRTPRLTSLYQDYLDSQDTAGFISRVSQHYTIGTLQRLAEAHGAETRRAAILSLGFLGDYSVNHSLGRALHDDDRTVRMMAENGIRNVWARAGTESERRELSQIIQHIAAQQYEEAIEKANELIDRAAWFAEAWHQRAIAYFRLERYADSVRDCHQALEVNPYHFPAATSMGQAYLHLRNHVSALECFRRALRLNPNLEGVRVQVTRLARQIEET